jgi:ribonucleoside-diphosphate reductase alpha chain
MNVSVQVTDEWMRKVIEDPGARHIVQHKEWGSGYLYRNSKGVVKAVKAKDCPKDTGGTVITVSELFNAICNRAHSTGEPGLAFWDRVEKDWVFKKTGKHPLESTNPCGEIPLESGGSCNLGSINLSKFVIEREGKPTFHYEVFEHVVATTVMALDNIVEINEFPVELIAKTNKATRRIGLGVMGWADLLFQLGIPYESQEARDLANDISQSMSDEALRVSNELGMERGTFSDFADSDYALDYVGGNKENGFQKPARNAYRTMIAPTGTVSIIADCSCGIEPIFSLAFTREVLQDAKGERTTMTEVNPHFKKALLDYMPEGMKMDEYINPIIDYAAKNGTLRGYDKPLPGVNWGNLVEVFQTAKDVGMDGHVLMQAAWQKHVDQAVSKCVAKGTRILTNKGLLKIEDLGNARIPGEFGPPLHNLTSLCPDGKMRKVLRHYCQGVKDTLRVRLDNGAEIEGSKSHKIMTHDGWKQLKTLEIGDLIQCRAHSPVETSGGRKLPQVSYSSNTQNSRLFPTPERMTTVLAELLGALAADGHLGGSTGLIALYEKDELVGEKYDSMFELTFGTHPKVSTDSRTGVRMHSLNSMGLCRWIAGLIGWRCDTKKIPEEIMMGSQSEQKAFLAGLSLDGYKIPDRKRVVLYCGKGQKLAQQVRSICHAMGMAPYFFQKSVSGHDYQVYGVSVPGFEGCWESRKDVAEKGLPDTRRTLIPRSMELPVLTTKHSSYSALRHLRQTGRRTITISTARNLGLDPDPTIYYQKVTSITSGRAELFDIEVEETHDYLVDGITSHNTINLPSDAPVSDVQEAYKKAWSTGCKGITVYRDGCRDNMEGQVQPMKLLTKADTTKMDAPYPPELGYETLARGQVKKLPEIQHALQVKQGTAMGTLHITMVHENGEPLEIFGQVSKAGEQAAADLEAICRLASLVLRLGGSISMILKQIEHIGSSTTRPTKNGQIKSIPDGMAVALKRAMKFLKNSDRDEPEIRTILQTTEFYKEACEDCGAPLVHQSGCLACSNPSCGYSKC